MKSAAATILWLMLAPLAWAGGFDAGGSWASQVPAASSVSAAAVGISQLSATGSAGATTFLRGDNTWATPAGTGASLGGNNTFTGSNTFSLAITSTNGIVGSTAADSAAAGNYGEFISTTSTSFTNIATSGSFGNVVSMAFSAGDWDASGCVTFKQNSATITDFEIAISTNSGTGTGDHVEGYNWLESGGFPIATANSSLCIPKFRVSVGTSTTIFLKIKGAYAAATPQAIGTLLGRRRR